MTRKPLDTVRLSTRGQIVLPDKVREALGAKQGDIVVFYEEGGKIWVERLK